MMHRRAMLAGPLLLLAGCATTGSRVSLPPGTRLIVLRHGDRDGENLNARGRERAAALVPALDGVEIDAIYSPGIQRNLDTAAPLAAARGLPITRIPADDPAARLVRENAGRTVVWVGNKGNLAQIWEALGAEDPPPLQYGDLFIVERGALGQPRVTRRRFGPGT